MKVGAVASERPAEEAADRVLLDGGSAADALLAGFFGSAAARQGVLLGPLQALVAGPGAGLRAFDGRVRQPGRGLGRPRGFVRSEEIPQAALVAVPASLGALALLHAYGGALPLERLAAPALDRAKALGARERADVIAKIVGSGASALHEGAILRPLVAVAGRTSGGLVSEEDLAEVRPLSAPPKETDLGGGRRALSTPWVAPRAPHRVTEFLVVVDAAGVMAALCYTPDDEGVPVKELGLTLPRDAVVVRRGVPRVTPGEALPCPAPLTIVLEDGVAFIALGVRSVTPIEVAEFGTPWADRSTPASMLLAAAKNAAKGTAAGAVLRSTETDRVQKVSI